MGTSNKLHNMTFFSTSIYISIHVGNVAKIQTRKKLAIRRIPQNGILLHVQGNTSYTHYFMFFFAQDDDENVNNLYRLQSPLYFYVAYDYQRLFVLLALNKILDRTRSNVKHQIVPFLASHRRFRRELDHHFLFPI